MTGQTVGAIIQDRSVAPPLGVESRPLGGGGGGGGAGSFTDEVGSILSCTSQLARTLLGHTFAPKRRERPVSAEGMNGSSGEEDNSSNARRKREFTPNEKKDDGYWDKRKKNNEAAKRSREKRRANDMVLERRVLALLEENACLRAELLALKFRFGLVKDPSDVSILPLSAPHSAHPAPRTTHYYQTHTDGPSYFNTQPGNQHTLPQPAPQGANYRPRASEPPATHSPSEESSVSTSCSSNVGSPLFFDDAPGGFGRPSPRELAEEQQGSGSHICPVEVCESQYASRQDSPDGLRSLPHKLRFKGPGGSSEGGETSLSPDVRHGSLPVATVGPSNQMRSHQQVAWDGQASYSKEEACGGYGQQYQGSPSEYYNSFPQNSRDNKYSAENPNLRSQIQGLSQEVAQLKRLFSQQLLSKIG
ncbi:NFIL3 like protein-like [Brachyistius frenatus]|uniref:NFIL3 like protein-like n=1 Tax=Brachyistius frenatus TaxID=100188 RepID=UPI0037E959FA